MQNKVAPRNCCFQAYYKNHQHVLTVFVYTYDYARFLPVRICCSNKYAIYHYVYQHRGQKGNLLFHSASLRTPCLFLPVVSNGKYEVEKSVATDNAEQ